MQQPQDDVAELTGFQNISRSSFREYIFEIMPADVVWGFRGGVSGCSEWKESDKVKDLDIWVALGDRQKVDRVLAGRARSIVSRETAGNWLEHTVFCFDYDDGPQLVDVAYGDQKVGPLVTCPEELVTLGTTFAHPTLAGVSLVSDLFLRKIFRLKLPKRQRFEEAVLAWRASAAVSRELWNSHLQSTFGSVFSNEVSSTLDSGTLKKRIRFYALIGAFFFIVKNLSLLTIGFKRRRRLVFGAASRRPLKRPTRPILIFCDRSTADMAIESVSHKGYKGYEECKGLRGVYLLMRGGLVFSSKKGLRRMISSLVARACGALTIEIDKVNHYFQEDNVVECVEPVLLRGCNYRTDTLIEILAHSWYIDNVFDSLSYFEFKK